MFCNVCIFRKELIFAINGGPCMLSLRGYCQKNSGSRMLLMYDTWKSVIVALLRFYDLYSSHL